MQGKNYTKYDVEMVELRGLQIAFGDVRNPEANTRKKYIHPLTDDIDKKKSVVKRIIACLQQD